MDRLVADLDSARQFAEGADAESFLFESRHAELAGETRARLHIREKPFYPTELALRCAPARPDDRIPPEAHGCGP